MRTFLLALVTFAGFALTANTADAGPRRYGPYRGGFYGRPYYGPYSGGGFHRPNPGGFYRPYDRGFGPAYRYGYRPGFSITIGNGGFVPFGGYGPGLYGPGFYGW